MTAIISNKKIGSLTDFSKHIFSNSAVSNTLSSLGIQFQISHMLVVRCTDTNSNINVKMYWDVSVRFCIGSNILFYRDENDMLYVNENNKKMRSKM